MTPWCIPAVYLLNALTAYAYPAVWHKRYTTIKLNVAFFFHSTHTETFQRSPDTHSFEMASKKGGSVFSNLIMLELFIDIQTDALSTSVKKDKEMTIEAAIQKSEESQAEPVPATSMLVKLTEFAQQSLSLAASAEAALDAVTKEYNLLELEEHLDAFMRSIADVRVSIKEEKKREILNALLQLAGEFEVNSIAELLDAAGHSSAHAPTIKRGIPATNDNVVIKKRAAPIRMPKVFANLLKEEHNGGTVDLKKGHNGILKGKNPGWHYKIGTSPNPAYYRPASAQETAKMEKVRSDYNTTRPKL